MHHHHQFGRTGFESSQQTRMRLAQSNQMEYIHLITSPQTKDFERRFQDIGFDYGLMIALDHFLMGTHAVFVDKYHYKYYNDSGSFIGSAFYDKNASVSSVEMWIYEVNGRQFTEEDLIVEYLSKNSESNDVIFRDDSRIVMPKLSRFVQFRGLLYYEIIHHSVLDDGYMPTLSKKIKYLVANEEVAEQLAKLGYQSEFLPPMCIDEDNLKRRSLIGVKRYVWSAHLDSYKNFGQALRVMAQLEDSGVTLDVYGGALADFDRHCELFGKRPNNVTYKGFVSVVPYWDYEGYLSTSRHEMFANACIEAMSYGLKAVTSDLKYPYLRYETESKGALSTANTDAEYVQMIMALVDKPFDSNNQIDFLKRYSYQRWAPLFKELTSK